MFSKKQFVEKLFFQKQLFKNVLSENCFFRALNVLHLSENWPFRDFSVLNVSENWPFRAFGAKIYASDAPGLQQQPALETEPGYRQSSSRV